MQKLLCLFLTLCLLFCALPGCGAGNQPSSAPTPSAVATPSPTPVPTPEPTPAPDILDSALPIDENGVLYSIPCEKVSLGVQQELALFGDSLLVWGSRWTQDRGSVLQLYMISLSDGSLLREAELSNLDTVQVQVCGDTVAVSDFMGRVILLDKNLDAAAEYTLGADSCVACVSPDASVAYSFARTHILATELATGKETKLVENSRNLYLSRRCGNSAAFSYTDPVTRLNTCAVLDLRSGEMTLSPFDEALYSVEYSGGVWLTGSVSQPGWLLDSGESCGVLNPGGSLFLTLTDEPCRILARDHSSSESISLHLYDAGGKFISSCTPPGVSTGYEGSIVWSEEHGGFFLLSTEKRGRDNLLFWDLSVPVSGEDLTVTEKTQPVKTGSAVSPELYARADELSRRYGITINIAELCSDEYFTYTVEIETDEALISAALDEIETVLSEFPENFLPQLRYDTYRETEINLTGTLTRRTFSDESQTGFTNFVGFVEQASGKNIMVLDITRVGSVGQTCRHEFSHMIENVLRFDASLRSDALFSSDSWTALNPEGYVYPLDYNNLPENFYNDGLDNWFIDLYSRTYPSEDRARIFEYAMSGYTWAFYSPQRLAKLEYYSRCIRDAFDTTGWPERTVWEAPLG